MDKNWRKEAEIIHSRAVVIDAHCDTISRALIETGSLGEPNRAWHLDLPKMKSGGIKVQVFAVFPGTGSGFQTEKGERALNRTLLGIDRFFAEMEANNDRIAPAFSFSDIEEILAAGKVAALLSVEGGEALAGDLANLRILYRLGVRALGLTWNGRNEIADGVGEERTGGGLTSFGVEVVREMNRLGMLVDVSHLAEKGFWDVLETSAAPVIASHSNCRAVCNHRRNLTDAQIRALAAAGGVMGLNFYPPFVHRESANLEILLRHVDHVCNLVGSEFIGLGSDFDGFASDRPVLRDASYLPELTAGLLWRGYQEQDIHRILGGNWLRVFSRVLGRSPVTDNHTAGQG